MVRRASSLRLDIGVLVIKTPLGQQKGYNNGASGAAALLANGMGNTVTASGSRPQLRSSRNSAHFRTARERNQIKVSFNPPDGCAQFVRWFARKTQSPQARE
jgi:hypothetical protein